MTQPKTLTIADYDQYIADWIEVKLDSQPRLDDLAANLGYSKRMIQHHFKKKHGMTIGDYIHNRRIYRACVLLRMTELSVGEIACRLHFSSHHNFCRAFKTKLNCTPLSFRLLPASLLPSLALPQMNYRGHIAYHVATLEEQVLVGVVFQYQDSFIAPNSIGGEVKMRRLQSWFQDNRAPLVLASKVEQNHTSLDSRANMVNVSVIAGNAMHVAEAIDLPDGAVTHVLDGRYLCCPFHGFFSDYAAHNKDIYMHLLPKLHLKREEGRDIEFFYFTHHIFDEHPKVTCKHYIPITYDDESRGDSI